MDSVDIWRRVLMGAIVAVLVLVVIGGAYFLYAWSKVGSGSKQDDAPLTPIEQQRKVLDSFTAPTPRGTSTQQGAPAYTPPPQTPSAFDAPSGSSAGAPQKQQEPPPTPSSFNAPSK